ncbi:MAG: lytic transglycosylase domain-containing protein [Acidobacteria bacterium]|nr:lytic transglycosylase domain-containing protein [Acidobacteriota bacterium]
MAEGFFYRRFLPSRLLFVFAVIGTFLNVLHAAEPLSAHRDSDGRVVFTNEEASYYSASQGSVRASSADSSRQPSPTSTSRIHDLIEGVAELHRVDPALIRAVVQVESNFNPFAVSPKGAMGLMQLIPTTARRFGVRNVFDPRANLDGGVRYMKYLMELFGGDLRLALAAYNAGENAVSRIGRIPSFPETRNYLRKISQLYPLDRPIPTTSTIQRLVDGKGIVHFSNTGAP